MDVTLARPTDKPPDHPRERRPPGLTARKRYAAVERGITAVKLRAERAECAERAVAEAAETAQRRYDYAVSVAGPAATAAELVCAGERCGCTGIAYWIAQADPSATYAEWCAGECRRAYADMARDSADSAQCAELMATSADIEIEQGRLDSSVRREAIAYATLVASGRCVEAETYLDRLRPRPAYRVPVNPRPCHARRSSRRTTRSRRTPTASRATGDPDPEPEPPAHRRPLGCDVFAERVLQETRGAL